MSDKLGTEKSAKERSGGGVYKRGEGGEGGGKKKESIAAEIAER